MLALPLLPVAAAVALALEPFAALTLAAALLSAVVAAGLLENRLRVDAPEA